MNISKMISLLLLCFLSTSFLAVSFDVNSRMINYFFALIGFSFISIFIYTKSILDKSFFKIINNYYLAILLSTFLGFLAVYILDNSIFSFKEINMYGRILNVILFSMLAWFIVSLSAYNTEYFNPKKMAFFYALGCFILILTGYWQALSLYLGIGSFPFETRSMVHGVGKSDYDIQGRLTGIAAEPSFFVPFVLDFMILSLIIFKRNIIKFIFFCIGALVLLLSFSPSGYVSALSSLGLALILVANFKNRTYVTFVSIFLVAGLFFIVSALDKFKNIGYVLGRVENIGEDVRFQTIFEVINTFLNSNILTILFGYGVTNFKFAALRTNYNMFETSNNVLVDVVVEMGIVGLCLFLGIFVKIFLLIRRSSTDLLQKFICYALFFDLLITGMVRADYASSRFFILIALIVLFSKYNLDKKI
ncbi:O-antigen ligase family protein [Acinetobacter calcoaceticus]|uniref:O-antigen ligase family protein n=1 Tax=Acinetobacter calcoaceticus TaxID=471 RepID=UPI000AD05AF9|nr:O-antigen ligase family protein [Acinetobacter calcoaceticus]